VTQEREVHELAEAFPPMDEEAFAALVEDIRQNGLLTRITMTEDGKILDGRNRYRACLAADVEPKYEVYHGDGTREDLVGFVISRNFHRRHLTESQRAMVAARMVREGVTVLLASSQLNVSRETVRKASDVLESAAPNVVSMVDRGKTSVHRAHQVVKGALAEEDIGKRAKRADAKIEPAIPEPPRPAGRPRGNTRVNAVRRGLEEIAPLLVCVSEILAHWPPDDAALNAQLNDAALLLNTIRDKTDAAAVA
jgi:ParB-like chromosome segregation protein Spo0J